MGTKRVWVFLLMCCFLVTAGLTGCGGKGNPSSTTSISTSASSSTSSTSEIAVKDLPKVELSWYLMSYKPMEDTPLVEEAMNKILLEKINATIKINVIAFADYNTKMNVKIAAGDVFDVMFTNGATYSNLAAKGALVDLTDLIPKYAPDLKNVLTPAVFDLTRISGKIYAVPNLQGLCMPTELAVRKDLFDKYKMPSTITSFNELDDAFDKILKNDKVIPLHVSTPGGGSTVYNYYMNSANFFRVGSPIIPGVYTSDMKIVNQYESDNFKNWITWARKAYEKGWIEKNAATNTGDNAVADFKAGKYACEFNAGGPQGRDSMNSTYGTDQYKYEFISFGVKNTLLTAQIQGTMNSISSTSKNPERALMLVNLINTNKALYNLMCFGIEGTHYVLNNGVRELPKGITDETNKYNMAVFFFVGNTYNRILGVGENPNVLEEQRVFDTKATPEPAMGFSYDSTAMKTQIAQVTSVLEEFLPSLAVGAVDIDVYLPKMLEKLKTAGADQIIADKQTQLNKYVASKK